VGTKFIVNEINNMAAGVGSPITQQMISDAQNPAKNRFIRKPMSPKLNSLYIISPQSHSQINEPEAAVYDKDE